MAQTFFFIDGIYADRASKRQMRRHVMKGKNVGKTLNRPSRWKQLDSKKISVRSVQYDGGADDGNSTAPIIPACGTLSNTSVVFWLPVEVTPQSLRVIHECEYE